MKYIVYKTTNLVNNYIYIGVHGTDTLETFDKYLGNELQTWPSADACAKEVGTAVKKVLQGEYRRHKGFIYKYKND